MAKPAGAAKVFKQTKRDNLAIAEAMIKKAGFKTYVDKRRNIKGVASFNKSRPDTIRIIKNSPYWSNPRKHSIDQRKKGHWSSSNPASVILHEIGHSRDRRSGFVNDPSKPWGIGARPFSSSRNQRLARRVSNYAATSSPEFVAETYAGRRTGRRYDYQVMRAYREEMGLPRTSVRRTIRSRKRR